MIIRSSYSILSNNFNPICIQVDCDEPFGTNNIVPIILKVSSMVSVIQIKNNPVGFIFCVIDHPIHNRMDNHFFLILC